MVGEGSTYRFIAANYSLYGLTMHKILGGPANTDEMVVENRETGATSCGFTVRVYDVALREWRIY